MKNLLFTTSLLFFSFSFAFAQNPVQHEIGIDLGAGTSNFLSPQSTSTDYQITWLPSWSMSNSIKYNALLFNKRLNLGVGLGYLRRGAQVVVVLDDPNFRNPITFYSDAISEAIMLPIEVGYRLPLGGAHSLMADALFIPTYQLLSAPSTDRGNNPPFIVPTINRFNFDVGLKLGYRLQMTESLSLQASILGTVQPVELNEDDKQFYNIQLNLGVRHQF